MHFSFLRCTGYSKSESKTNIENIFLKNKKNKITHMLHKYTYTQVIRLLNEVYLLCIFILEGTSMEVFT